MSQKWGCRTLVKMSSEFQYLLTCEKAVKLAQVKLQCSLLLNWKAFPSCDKRERLPNGWRELPAFTCHQTISETFDDHILSRSVTLPLLYLLFIYTQHPSFHLLSLHASQAPSFILPSSISLFLYSCVIPSIHSTLPRGVREWLPVLTASYLTFSPLLWSNRRPSHTKSYRSTLLPADSSTSGRGWLHLQTLGHNGLVHPAV